MKRGDAPNYQGALLIPFAYDDLRQTADRLSAGSFSTLTARRLDRSGRLRLPQ